MTGEYQIRRDERKRLEVDIAARHRLQSVDAANELVLRLEDVIQEINMDLNYEAERPVGDPPDPKRAEWRTRAQRALSRMEFALRQVTKRRDLLARQEQRK